MRSYNKELKSHYFLLTDIWHIITPLYNFHNITPHHNSPKVKELKN